MIYLNGYNIRSGVIDYYVINEAEMRIFISIKGTEIIICFNNIDDFLTASNNLAQDII